MIKDKSSKGLRRLVASRKAADDGEGFPVVVIGLEEVAEILISLTERVEALEKDKWMGKKL